MHIAANLVRDHAANNRLKFWRRKLRYDVDLMSRIVTQLLLVARLENLNIDVDERLPVHAHGDVDQVRTEFRRAETKTVNLSQV